MSKAAEYINAIKTLIDTVSTEQTENIQKCAELFANSLENGGWVYLFGTGHSHMLAEELFYRAGGLVRVKPILEEGLMLHQGASKSTELERLSGYSKILLDEYNVTDKDTIVIISNSGRNSVCIEMAMEAKKRGLSTIALTNLIHSTASESRHESGKRLFELTDVVIDNCGCYGDACISFGNRMAAPTSTAIGSIILNAIICATIEIIESHGETVELYSSSNISGGSEINNKLIGKYKGQIKGL